MANQSKRIRAVQLSGKRHCNLLVAMPNSSSSGGDGSHLVILWSVSTTADCRGQFQLFMRRLLDELVCGQLEVLGG